MYLLYFLDIWKANWSGRLMNGSRLLTPLAPGSSWLFYTTTHLIFYKPSPKSGIHAHFEKHVYVSSLKIYMSTLPLTNRCFQQILVYVALSDPGVIWGQKYHLCRFSWKLKFGHWNHQRCIPWWQKMQKRAEKWPKKTFLNFLALWPRRLWSIFTPYVCYLEGISTIWATPYEVKSLN